jgi:hypothetical protein
MVGVRGDDPHAFDLAPGNLGRRLGDLIRQLGGNVTQSADDGLARKAQRGAQCPSASCPGSPVRLPHRRPQPDLPEGLRLPWSQIYGLGTNVFVPRLQGTPRDDIDSDAQEFLKILEQADVIK